MPDDTSDQGWRRAFRELRRSDEHRAIDFESTLRRTRRRSEPIALRLPLAAAAVGAVSVAGALAAAFFVLQLWRGPPRPTRPGSTPDLLAWKAPTDFLLETPGLQVLRSVPQIVPAIPRGDPWPREPAPSVPTPEKTS